MTGTIGKAATVKVIQRITGPKGVNSGLAALTQGSSALASPLEASQVRSQNVAADVAERSAAIQYPAVNVYCEKIVNSLHEKFRTFSGSVQMTMELRHSQDRLDGLQDALELYTDALTQVLNVGRGDWGDGMFYGGAYQVSFGPVKKGGKNYIQVAKVTFEIGVSRS
jgi:ABC-type transporter Mla subunit MlaD